MLRGLEARDLGDVEREISHTIERLVWRAAWWRSRRERAEAPRALHGPIGSRFQREMVSGEMVHGPCRFDRICGLVPTGSTSGSRGTSS